MSQQAMRVFSIEFKLGVVLRLEDGERRLISLFSTRKRPNRPFARLATAPADPPRRAGGLRLLTAFRLRKFVFP